MKFLGRLLLVLVFFLAGSANAVLAQDSAPNGPVYVVQSGDTLWVIAQRFGVSMDELVRVNNLANANAINVGDALVIPGLVGVTGRLETKLVPFGENLASLSRRYQVEPSLLARLNHLTISAEVYAGYNLIVPVQEEPGGELGKRASLQAGQSLLEMSVVNGVNPWQIAGWNALESTNGGLPGEVFHLPGEDAGPGALPAFIHAIAVSPLPLIQGKAAVLKIEAEPGLQISGSLIGHALNFFYTDDGVYTALQGVHALTEPGIYPLVLKISGSGMEQSGLTQFIYVASGGYATDPDLTVDPATIDEQVTRPEDAQWTALAQPATPEKLWDGLFVAPVGRDFAECWPSVYGNRRSYNGGSFKGFHTGLDFCGAVGQPIYAPAPGIVVFAGPLTVRGQATMIDHGWGIYSGYMHQSEILVQVGQRVESGEQIGLVGNTGRVTGPHLHFEIWAGGVQIDPLDWLTQVFP